MTDLFLSCLGISMSAGVVTAVLLLFSGVSGGRYAAKWRRRIWIFLALWLILPLGGELFGAAIEVLVQKGEALYGGNLSEVLTDKTVQSLRIELKMPEKMTEPIEMHYGEVGTVVTVLDIMAAAWGAGALIFLGVHLAGYLSYRYRMMKHGRILGKQNVQSEETVLDLILELKGELRIRHAVLAVESPEASSPMMIGFLKPVVILPKEQYSKEELYFILKHELVHLKCRDVYFKLLFVTANAVHWFNPIVWIMQKEAAVAMETACDERVVRGAEYSVRKAYTETLLSALDRQCGKRTVLSTQFYGGTEIMKKRFANILAGTEKKKGVLIWLCVMLLTVSLGVLSGCSAGREGQGERLSDEELCRLAGEYYARRHDGFVPPIIEVDSVNDTGQVLIHLYENGAVGMGMTYDWYTVDPVTRIGETVLFDEVNLLE